MASLSILIIKFDVIISEGVGGGEGKWAQLLTTLFLLGVMYPTGSQGQKTKDRIFSFWSKFGESD